MQSVLILGRQPALGLAELESLYGAVAIRPIQVSLQTGKAQQGAGHAALLDLPPEGIDFDRLGGSIKLCKVLTTLSSTDWNAVETYLVQSSAKHAEQLPDGKMQVGISAYSLRVTPQRMLATGLTLKKVLKRSGRSVRLVPNKELALNSASVLHNKLTGPTGWELVFIRDGERTIVAQTVAEQDIDNYTIRDRDRPKRDARVGMLPPKLAQIIINLAVGNALPSKDRDVLDPFCGTGVVLQEAMLMGFSATGSDVDQRMIDYTNENLDWLWKTFPQTTRVYRGTQLGDATNHQWKTSKVSFDGDQVVDAELIAMKISAVASETYLGKPFTSAPSNEVLNQTASDCNLIIKKFLVNIRTQLPRGARLCLAIPAWQVRRGQFKHLPFIGEPQTSSVSSRLDSLRELGYNRISFEHARTEDLMYYREDQIVARELLVLEKL